ncbi:MAG: adenylate/guanylate cyclase domain-containing protein [Termitinemataceae bacterium]
MEITFSTILFTDIKGSTKMYEALGDTKAFHLVREHFRILFRHIQAHDGIVIKTIGDAVMGVFVNEQKALHAAIESQLELQRFYKDKAASEKIEVKIGLHSGPAIVVTLNNRLDYFGSTVNIAARIQGLARPNEILFSAPIYNNIENRRLIKKYTPTVFRKLVNLRGLKDNYEIFSIRCTECTSIETLESTNEVSPIALNA